MQDHSSRTRYRTRIFGKFSQTTSRYFFTVTRTGNEVEGPSPLSPTNDAKMLLTPLPSLSAATFKVALEVEDEAGLSFDSPKRVAPE